MISIFMKHSDKILKSILGRDVYKELIEYIPVVLDKRIGENHSAIDGIYITRLLEKFILHIGTALARGYTFGQIEEIYNPIYKKIIHFNSINDIYITFKKYIDIVIEFVK